MLAVTLFFLFVGARWIWIYRHGQPLDIDEAGYLGFALGDYYALLHRGVIGWLRSVEGRAIYAPVTTALSSLLFVVTGPHVIAGFAVPLLAGTSCIPASYFLGKSLGSRQIGLIASILVASCPIILVFSRSFHFSMPVTLALTVALLALLKSNRFERIGWAVVFGISLGLMPLTRTMTIAFVPGVVIGAFVYAVAEPIDRSRRVLMLSLALLLAAFTAATWLGPHGRAVFEYLFSFGYGPRAAEYGAAYSGLDAWLNTLRVLCNSGVYLPHLLIILAGAAAALSGALIEALTSRSTALVYRVVRSRTVPLFIVVAEAWSALASSRDQGSAFFAPIVPAMLVLTAWAFVRISSHQYYRLTVVLLLAAVAIGTSIPFLDLRTPFSAPWIADLPVLGQAVVTDGRGSIQRYEAAGRLGPSNVAEPIGPAAGRAWINLSAETAMAISRLAGSNAVTAFGFRHFLYNVNSVNLQQLLSSGTQFGMRQIEPFVTGESIQSYLAWLTNENVDACVLLTSDKVRGDIPPPINRAYMRQAAEQAGFIPVEDWPTPDGQTITLWQRQPLPANCR
ncbi:MAG TPA: glycosyltransferase family 39 protein [Xanthobacteraceae bacterium]|nr:glycosyltransferase family 39 protein [Xanthobacteraceae bacterium]